MNGDQSPLQAAGDQRDAQGRPRSLRPMFDSPADGRCLLHSGPVIIANENGSVTLPGVVAFDGAPRYKLQAEVAARFADVSSIVGSFDSVAATFPDDTMPSAELHELPDLDPDDGSVWTESVWLNRFVVGSAHRVHSLVIHLVGSIRIIQPPIEVDDGSFQVQVAFSLPGWELTLALLDSGIATDQMVVRATSTGGAPDEGSIDVLLRRLFLILSFVAGTEIGSAIVCGLDADEQLVWLHAAVPRTRPTQPGAYWCPPSASAGAIRQLSRFFDSTESTQDRAWERIVGRGIEYELAASASNEVLDVRVPVALAGLELVAWAVDQRESQKAVELADATEEAAASAGTRIERLLRWASVDVAIPESCAALGARANRLTGQGEWNGPRIVANVRNKLVHAPSRLEVPEWPSSEELVETWHLATGYLELALLRVLGYEGTYLPRRFPRWVYDDIAVPWTNSASRMDTELR